MTENTRKEFSVGKIPAFRWIRTSDEIPPLYAQENVEDPMVHVKLFQPWGAWTWYLTRYSPVAPDGVENLGYGLVCGFEKETGYIPLDELAQLCGPGGLRIERDIHFQPLPMSVIRQKEGL